MEIARFASDVELLFAAAAGLVATLIAIVRDTQIRRRPPGTAIR